MDLLRNHARRGCDCACRNLTMPQLVKTSSDHLKCLLKEDIIKLCRFHDISCESWKSKGLLITCLKDQIYCKKFNIKNLCDHNIYINISTKYPDIFGFDDKEDIIDPHHDLTIFFDGDDDISRIVISKDKPTVYEEGTYVAYHYKTITNILYERNISEINDTIVIKPNDESQWKTATLKLNSLMKELIRLGADKHETYSCIIDLHQDIVIPHHDEIDKEIAVFLAN